MRKRKMEREREREKEKERKRGKEGEGMASARESESDRRETTRKKGRLTQICLKTPEKTFFSRGTHLWARRCVRVQEIERQGKKER